MIHRYLVMVQREVGERIAANVGDAAFGAVSVKVAWWAAARVVGRVPPTVFLPPPKVDSALVELVRHREPPVVVRDRARMFALINAGFATRRKMLRRALAGVLDEDVFAARGRRFVGAGRDTHRLPTGLDSSDAKLTRSPSSRCRCTSPACAPTATTSSTR